MQQQVAMNRNLSRLEFVIDGLAELLGCGHRLIQNVGLIVFTKRIREVPRQQIVNAAALVQTQAYGEIG
jgi:hypothetical protein